MTQFRSVALIGAGRPGAAAGLSLVDLALTAALAFAGSLYGVEGTAAGVVVAALAAAVLTSAVIHRVLGVGPGRLLRACAPPYIACLAMVAALIAAGIPLVGQSAMLRLAVLIPLGAVIFGSWLVLAHRPWLSARISYLRGRGSGRE